MSEILRIIVPASDDVDHDWSELKAMARHAATKAITKAGATQLGNIKYTGIVSHPLVLDEGGPPVNIYGATLHSFEVEAVRPNAAA